MKKKYNYFIIIALITLSKLSFGQVIYLHGFGTTTFTAVNPYIVAPNTIDANLSGSQWTTNLAAGFNDGVGATGKALNISNSSGSPTYSLSYNIAGGFLNDITAFSFWSKRSGTGAPNWTLTINGITVGAGTTPTAGISTGTVAVSSAVNGLSGTANVVLALSGGTNTAGTFRIDDFTLYGTVYSTVTCTPPTIQASSFATSAINNNSATVNWTAGNGTNVIVLAHQASAVNASPANGIAYTANSIFGSGQQIGTGNYVVYNGTGNSVNVTGLITATDYYFSVFEYNNVGDCYLSPALTGSLITTGSPSTCFEIQSILVDACDGGNEGQNEMVIFQVGSTPLSVSTLTVNWASGNLWRGICQNAGTAADVNTVNGTITGCGLLVEPVAGVLKANSKVLLVTGTQWNPLAQSFADLNDTLTIIFQCYNAGNTGGHFANYTVTPTPDLRTLQMGFSSTCNDVVTYNRNLLIKQNQLVGAQDGGAVEFTASGVANYVNNNCKAPYVALSVDAGASSTVCAGGSQALTAVVSGPITNVNWSLGTGATGSFAPNNSLSTNYSPGVGELGTVKVYCTVKKICGIHTVTAKDSTNITVLEKAQATISSTNGFSLCPSTSSVLSYSVTNSSNTGVVTPGWSSPAGAGSTYTVTAPSGTTSVTYTLNLSNTCGTTSKTFTVYPLALPTVSLSATTPTACVGNTVSLTATGNTGNYSWTNPVSTNSTVTLTANTTTTGIVTSTNSCGTVSATYTLTVTQNPVLTVDNPNVTLCAGQSATVTATSSTGTYTWQPDAVNTNSIVVNLPGTHTVSTSNVCNSASVAVSVTVNATPVLSISTTSNSLCAGGQTTATLSLVGSTGTYSWSTGATGSTIAISTPGVYSATVNAGLCGTKGATISIGTLITPTLSVSSTSTLLCDGATATITASSNLADFSWSNGATNTPTIAVTAASLYSVSVTNACATPSASVNILTDVTPTLNLVSNTTTLCPSQSATLTVTGGIDGSYTWSNSASTSSVVTAIAGTVSVTYSNVCGSDTKSVSITTIPNPTVTITTNSINACPGALVNIMAVSSEGNYAWSGSAITTATLAINASGSTSGTVTTTNVCNIDASDTYTINVIPTPTLTVDNQNPQLCTGQSATITATSSEGTYTWQPGGSNNDALTVNSAGNYTVYTSNACVMDSVVVSVSINSTPTLTISSTSPSLCLTGQTATLSTAGSTGIYNWSDGSSLSSLVVNTPGIYTATVTTPSCGFTVESFTVDATPTPTILLTSSSSTLLCNGVTATLTASTNMANEIWSDGSSNINSIFVNMAGIYTVGVSNACGAPTASINILTDVTPTLNVVSTNSAICSGSTATLSVTGGVEPYTWSNSILTGSVVTTNGGTVTVSGTNGCGTDTETISVSIMSTPTVSLASSSSLLCNGVSATLTASSNMSNEIWSDGSANVSTIMVNASGTYTVGVSNACGTPSASINIQTNTTPTLNLTASSTTLCPNQTATLTVTGGGSPYVWSNSTNTGSVVTTIGGIVTVSYSNACGTDTQTVTVVTSSVNAAIIANPASGSTPLTVNFSNNSVGANSYVWTFGNGITANTQTVVAQTYTTVGNFTAYLMATDGTCFDTDSVLIHVLNEEPVLIIPNVFTPNNDSVNDVFRVTGINILGFDCVVFDRWGLQMYAWSDIKGGWDGTAGGKSVPAATYFYIINAKDINNKDIKKQGTISLFR